MLISDLVRINPAPQVICLGEIGQLKEHLRNDPPLIEETAKQLQGLLEQYFVSENDNRQALEAILRSLSKEAGEAFLVCGPYGAGKSHLLAVISLLAEFPVCWEYFLRTHEEFSRLAPQEQRKLLVVQIALDNYSGPAHNLEDIVFAAIESELASPWHNARTPLTETSHFLDLFESRALAGREKEWAGFVAAQEASPSWEELKAASPRKAAQLAQEFLEHIGLPLAYRRSRAEAVFQLSEHLKASGFQGVVLLVDELSTFLASKKKRELNQDASFLQFLAQQSANIPLWLICTAQRSLEDVGDIDSHTLRQIRDRFRGRFTLSISAIRRVIAEKLVEKRNTKTFPAQMTGLHREYAEVAQGLSFSTEELTCCYPVNPLVLECLEVIAANYLSSTRSLIGMVQKGLLLVLRSEVATTSPLRRVAEGGGLMEAMANRLLTLDRVFDLEAAELLALPEAARFRQAWEFLSRNLAGIVEPADLPAAEIVVKNLVLMSVAGFRWPVKRLAESLIGCPERRLWGNWAEVERLLRRLQRKGAYVEVVHCAAAGESEYFLEVSADLSEAVRRKVHEALASLAEEDERVADWALRACDGSEFPLAHFSEPHSVGVEWMGVRHHVNIACRRPSLLKEGEPAQAAATLASPSCREDGWLFLCPPSTTLEKEKVAWLEEGRAAQGRFKQGLLAWLPRTLTEQEWEILQEHAALSLLLTDATLAASAKGRQIRSRLQERLAGAKEECRRALQRAYLKGEILGADGAQSAPAEGKWEEILQAVFSGPLRKIFPNFPSVAPRTRLVGKTHTNQIIDRFLRPGQIALPPGNPLEEHLLNCLEPLGFLRRQEGRFYLSVSPGPLVDHILSLLPEPTAEPEPESVISFRDLLGRLGKGEYGLVAELAELVIAALVRAGYLRGLDGFLLPLHLNQAASPLSESIPFLMKASPLSEKERAWLAAFSTKVLGQEAATLDLAGQEALWDRLRSWAKRGDADLPEIRQALEGFVRGLGQEDIRWSASLSLLEQFPRLLEKDIAAMPSAPGMRVFLQAAERAFGSQFASANLPMARQAALDSLGKFAALRDFLRWHAPVLQEAFAFLSDSRLALPQDSPLPSKRAFLLEAFAKGEEMLPRAAKVAASWGKLHHAYLVRYRAWHSHQHSLARFRLFVDLKESETFRLGERLACARPEGAEEFVRLAAEMKEVLSRYCPGSTLPAALQSSPVCPQCGLRLGEALLLPDPREMAARLEAIVEKTRAALFRPERVSLLRGRLEVEPAGPFRRQMDALLSCAEPSLLTAEAAEWIGRQLSLQITAKRKVAELCRILQQRELTKAQALRLFHAWLDEHNLLGDGELIAIE